MAISNLLPAGGANDNRPNLKQFFGKNPAVSNDNVERVSSGMFTNTFMDSVVTTLHGLVDELRNITDIAKNVIASFGAIVKSLKSLNKEITSRFRVLNNDLNASKIDFIKAVLAIPKMGDVPKIDGVPININAPETAKDENKGLSFGELFASYLGIKMVGALIRSTLGGLLTFFISPPGLALLAFGGAFFLLYKGLQDITNAIMEAPEWKKFIEGRGYNPDGTKKPDVQLREETAKDIRDRNDPQGRQQRYKNREDALKNNSWGEDGKPIKISQVEGWFNPPNSTDEIWTLKEKLKDGTKYINISTGEKYLDTSIEKGVFKTVPTPGAAITPAAPAGTPVQAAEPQAAAPATGAGSFSLSGPTGVSGTSAAPAGTSAAPAGTSAAPAGTSAAPPGSPAVSSPPTVAEPPTAENKDPNKAGTPSLKRAIASAIPVPQANPSSENSTGGVSVITNTSVQNLGKVRGAETNGMTGQNLPMFARNEKLQRIWQQQILPNHQ